MDVPESGIDTTDPMVTGRMAMKGKKVFSWPRDPDAARLVGEILDTLCEDSDLLAALRARLMETAAVRLLDLITAFVVSGDAVLERDLRRIGYHQKGLSKRWGEVWRHDALGLPEVIYPPGERGDPALIIRVDNIADFLSVHQLEADINHHPLSSNRYAQILHPSPVKMILVEHARRGERPDRSARTIDATAYLQTFESWIMRPRIFDHPDTAVKQLMELCDVQIKRVGKDLAAHLFFMAERRYWYLRNDAAWRLKSRLRQAGIGFAARDHHTFRSSRSMFASMLSFFVRLGCRAREVFYAGDEAGWGAQVMEHPAVGTVLFLDVDMEPSERNTDLSDLSTRDTGVMGTVGLWCALHGDSLFQAGMHHLALKCDFHRMGLVLLNQGIDRMEPFSRLPYLRQAFTTAQRWGISEKRLADLLGSGKISQREAEAFRKRGALGSHLETIQRDQGFRGFSQTEVSTIIRQTDPREGS